MSKLGIPANDWEGYLAVRALDTPDATNQSIAETLGIRFQHGRNKGEPNRSYVQIRRHLARLPKSVEAEMHRKVVEGLPSPLGWRNLHQVYRAYCKAIADMPFDWQSVIV